MKGKKERIPLYKSREWQPFPTSLASLPYTAFLATAPALSIVLYNLININSMKNCMIYLGLTVSLMTNAQEVITTSGGSLTSNSTVANWSIGETIIETISNNNASVTSGFNQPSLQIISLVENIKSKIELSIFPNPTFQFVNIKYDGQLPINVKIFSIDGKVLSISEIKEQPTQLDFSDKKNGVYIIEITDKSGISNKYRIVKQ